MSASSCGVATGSLIEPGDGLDFNVLGVVRIDLLLVLLLVLLLRRFVVLVIGHVNVQLVGAVAVPPVTTVIGVVPALVRFGAFSACNCVELTKLVAFATPPT